MWWHDVLALLGDDGDDFDNAEGDGNNDDDQYNSICLPHRY